MKKTLSTIAILLTLCLAANAFAASPKNPASKVPPLTDEEVVKDPLYQRYWAAYVSCFEHLVAPLAFNHVTSSSLFTAVRAKANEECRAIRRMVALRVCELIVDPKTGPVPGSSCAGAKYREQYIDGALDTNTIDAIKIFDKERAEKGLPPRPSIDK